MASAKLKALNPEDYFRDLFPVLPSLPSNRVIDLAAMYSTAKRARLDGAELAQPLGHIAMEKDVARCVGDALS